MALQTAARQTSRRSSSVRETSQPHSAVKIERVQISGLFGLYDFDIPGESRVLGRTPILYGENGLGKTNILKILFHLLSPAERAGHRTALGEIKFKRVEVTLSSAVLVRASRSDEALEGPLRLEVVSLKHGNETQLGAWDWYPEHMKSTASQHVLAEMKAESFRSTRKKPTGAESKDQFEIFFKSLLNIEHNPLVGETAFLNALRTHVPPVYFLSAERILSSDNVERDEFLPYTAEIRRLTPEKMVARGREHALNEAISLASRRFSQLGIRAARKGSGSTHTIYRDLIRRLASRRSRKAQAKARAIEDLRTRLIALSEQYSRYSDYGLAPGLDGDSLVDLLGNVRPSEQSVAAEILLPYVESLTESGRDLDAAYSVIDTFVGVVNGFLYGKRLEFAVAEGLAVRDRAGTLLQPKDLSSGEQQLLLLFCHIALAHAEGGFFIIDEPEISLNVKWQRRLIDALLRLDAEKNLQFVMASHSLEILTKHREDVVPLREIVRD